MQVVAFKMKLFEGYAEEYKKRHDEIWPELVQLLRSAGVDDYHIFLDESSLALFAILKVPDPGKLDQLPEHPVMQRLWQHMKDIMETNSDGSPVVIPLQKVFTLP